MPTHTIIEDTITLTVTECCICGIKFAIPEAMLAQRRRTGERFYCPNGHSLAYTKSELDDLKDQLLQTTKKLEAAETSLRIERRTRERTEQVAEHYKRSRAAVKGQLTRAKQRISAGTCPCCEAVFPDLGAHMAEAHPEYAAPEPDDEPVAPETPDA